MKKKMLTFILSLVVANLSFSLAQADICLICNCKFVNIRSVEPKPGEFNTFHFEAHAIEPFNVNTTYESLQKYFYVDCSSENNVGQINNLVWPKLEVLGIFGNFHNSKWRKLESFPGEVKKQMTVLSLSKNLLKEIDDFELDDFANLKMVNLSQNQIEVIKKGGFSKLTQLKILDLSQNWLTKVEDWAFHGTDIRYLYLSRNAITHLTEEVFRGLNSLSVLDLSENKLTKFPNEFGNMLPSLTSLSVRNNSFQRVPELPKNVKEFDISHNQVFDFYLVHSNLEVLYVINNEIVSLSHGNFPELRVLMASHNNMNKLSSLQSDQIRILDLSYNKFDKVPELLTSEEFPLLEEVYLDGNPIGNVTFPEQGEPFTKLRVLSLSHLKYVKKIQRNMLQGVFPKIKYNCKTEDDILIDLSHNSIKFVDEEAFKMIPVCRIDLSNNNLKSLSKDVLPWFQMSYINLQDNPWQCDCNIQWMLDEFLTFMYENNPRQLFGMRCSTPSRYKNKMFAFWYRKSENVFCNSGPPSFFLDLAGGKKVEIWTASAITCVLLGCIILITAIVIIVLLCTRPTKKKKPASRSNVNGAPFYKKIQNVTDDKSNEWV